MRLLNTKPLSVLGAAPVTAYKALYVHPRLGYYSVLRGERAVYRARVFGGDEPLEGYRVGRTYTARYQGALSAGYRSGYHAVTTLVDLVRWCLAYGLLCNHSNRDRWNLAQRVQHVWVSALVRPPDLVLAEVRLWGEGVSGTDTDGITGVVLPRMRIGSEVGRAGGADINQQVELISTLKRAAARCRDLA